MNLSWRSWVWIGGLALILITLVIFLAPRYLETSYSAAFTSRSNIPGSPVETEPAIVHVATPNPLKGIYMTSCVAATPSWRESLKKLIETTELNTVLIDIKDYSGTISFPNNLPKSVSKSGCVVPDLKDFIQELHQSNIYVIGRISVFQDPSYTKLFPELAVKSHSTGGVWKDRKGLAFIDVGAKPYWDYIIQIAKASYGIGFDELNFDYIRYPSDGDMKDANYTWMNASSTKAATLESFFSYLHANLKDSGAVTSADLFGMTTTITNDMGIGQVLERALPYFDYIAPMVYPSHYPATWSGFANPADHPYEVIKIAMSEGKRREDLLKISTGIATSTPSKLRPWLQDFNLGATYGPDKIQAQIQAVHDSGLNSWILWSAGNTYTKEALKPE